MKLLANVKIEMQMSILRIVERDAKFKTQIMICDEINDCVHEV